MTNIDTDQTFTETTGRKTSCHACDGKEFKISYGPVGLFLLCATCGTRGYQLANEAYVANIRSTAEKDLIGRLIGHFDGIPVDMTEQRIFEFVQARSPRAYRLVIEDEHWRRIYSGLLG